MTEPAGSLGLESGVVRLVPYDTAWPAMYVAEVARLAPILLANGVTLTLDHMGSTAVPGLAAKPILDILAGREGDVELTAVIAALVAGGYTYRGEQGISGRDFFRRGDPRQYHLHLTAIGSTFWHDQRSFRDHLLAHADAAAAYESLKRALAARYPRDREAYIEGKTAFVQAIVAEARRLNPVRLLNS